VYDWLLRLAGFYKSYVPKVELSGNSVTIVALCHDFCKIGCYKTDMRWRKDRMGRWEQYPTYKFEEDFHFGGHGSKSVYLIQHFIKLTPLEAAAINSHMGAWDKSTYGNPSAVYEVNPLAWLLHVADEAASYQKEEE
jgi:predicted membrane-bound dolichyl-phosphate-mannose-protein mannosyltransferase